MLPPGLVLVFPDTEEILLMFTDATVGGIGHRIEAGPKVGIQKRTGEGRTWRQDQTPQKARGPTGQLQR